MVRCPVCESEAVRVVLNSKPRATCSSCGATWAQEGSWQRSIRAGQRKLVPHPVNGNGSQPAPELVIPLPDPVHQKPRRLPAGADPPAEEAVAT